MESDTRADILVEALNTLMADMPMNQKLALAVQAYYQKAVREVDGMTSPARVREIGFTTVAMVVMQACISHPEWAVGALRACANEAFVGSADEEGLRNALERDAMKLVRVMKLEVRDAVAN